MRTIQKGKRESYLFDSLHDFKSYLLKHEDVNCNYDGFTSIKYRDGYHYESTWEEFMTTYFKDGNKELTRDLRQYTRAYIDKFEKQYVIKKAYSFDVIGEFFDIGAVMMGEPECWLKAIEVKDDKFITINIQGAYHSGQDMSIVKHNAARVFAMAVVLEELNYMVRINMNFHIENLAKRAKKIKEHSVCIQLKDYDEHLDYKKLGIVLGVPFFRRGVLRVMELNTKGKTRDTFGVPIVDDGEYKLGDNNSIDKLESLLQAEGEHNE